MKELTTKTNVKLKVYGRCYNLYKNYMQVRKEKEVLRDLTLQEFIQARNTGLKVSATRLNLFTEKDVQKGLLIGNIEISDHALKRSKKRGYSKADIISCIWTGKRTELQCHRGKLKAVIEGFDTDNNPICLVIGSVPFMKYSKDNTLCLTDHMALEKNYLVEKGFTIVSIFPPTKEKFIRNVIVA